MWPIVVVDLAYVDVADEVVAPAVVKDSEWDVADVPVKVLSVVVVETMGVDSVLLSKDGVNFPNEKKTTAIPIPKRI